MNIFIPEYLIYGLSVLYILGFIILFIAIKDDYLDDIKNKTLLIKAIYSLYYLLALIFNPVIHLVCLFLFLFTSIID